MYKIDYYYTVGIPFLLNDRESALMSGFKNSFVLVGSLSQTTFSIYQHGLLLSYVRVSGSSVQCIFMKNSLFSFFFFLPPPQPHPSPSPSSPQPLSLFLFCIIFADARCWGLHMLNTCFYPRTTSPFLASHLY